MKKIIIPLFLILSSCADMSLSKAEKFAMVGFFVSSILSIVLLIYVVHKLDSNDK
jgi:hypothetical protein